MFTKTYRPSQFSEFVGNQKAIEGLLGSWPNWPTTFLITGPAGVGKTTLARLIANQLECSNFNIQEIDAGQDRGIDSIRTLIRTAHFTPLLGRTKVYIFDECQGLTGEAQQALLKITEEPPSNTYFIFCSTDPQKLIKTLKARCQQGTIALYPLTRKELGIIIKRICDLEKINLTGIIKDIATLCIDNADGIPRNAVMLFNKYYTYSTIEDVVKELTIIPEELIPNDVLEIFKSLNSWDMPKFIDLLSKWKGGFESLRIPIGHILKKQLLRQILACDYTSAQNTNELLTIFSAPIDNQLGDIELVNRIGTLYLYKINTERGR